MFVIPSYNRISQKLNPMTQAQQNMPLVTQIKEIIQNHYQNLSKKLLNEKVRTEIIPILITLFYETSNKDIPIGSHKSIFGSNQKILNCIQSNLFDQNGEQLKQNNKYNIARMNQTKKNLNFPFFCLNKLDENNEEVLTEKLIKKTVAFCKMINILENLEMTKGHLQQIFEMFRERKEKIRRIRQFQQIITERAKKDAIMKFYSNHVRAKKQAEGCRILLKFYRMKIEKYLSSLLLHEELTLKINFSCSQEWQKLRVNLLNRGFNILASKHKKIMKQTLLNIKKYNFAHNPWRTVWVRRLVYQTPSNLQTSFWRLLNFWENSKGKDVMEMPKQNILEQDSPEKEKNESLQKIKKMRGEINRNILAVVEKAGRSEEIEAILFTRQQKAQILWKQLEYIHNLFSLQSMIEAYSALEEFSAHARANSTSETQLIKEVVESEMLALNESIVEKCSQSQC